MKERFKEADQILNLFKRNTRDYILTMLVEFDTRAIWDKTLFAYNLNNKYLIYYSHKLYSNKSKWSCQCHFHNYTEKDCSHIAVIKIHNILTFNDQDYINRYLIYQFYKEIAVNRKIRQKRNAARLMRYVSPENIS